MSIQPAKISRVVPDSIAAELGFEVGDAIVSVNGQAPRDLIDYQFFCADEFLALEVLDTKGRKHDVELEKDYDEDLGLEFETALFDALIQCTNRCPFCFIDQQPPGKRESLYFKDDDYRLSFLYGSYLTLTNLPDREWDRIAAMRLSPLYVSVHATDPEVRTRLLKNPRAGLLLDQLQWFQDHDLQIHAQVVVCPGINDGDQLTKTLTDLARFHQGEFPAVISAAVVPVGLTRFRPDEDALIPVSRDLAERTIAQVQALQQQFQTDYNSTFAWLADEWFLIAHQPIPAEKHYEDYPQIGNGVGSIRLFLKEFEAAAMALPLSLDRPRRLTWIVGNAVEQAFAPVCDRLNQVGNLTVEMAALNSGYWGQEISVTGLITGQDIVAALKDQSIGDGLLVPSLMLKLHTTLFLDDMTVEQVAAALKTRIWIVDGVDGLIQTVSQWDESRAIGILME
jgi:putative radical SAM enzyme (TIGR03279 family)